MRTTFLALLLLASATTAGAQQFFQNTDGTVAFSKAAFADVSDPANWDIITDSVAITRADARGLYNPPTEDLQESDSPVGTLWFFGGTVQEVIDGTLTLAQFDTWLAATGGPPNGPPSTVGQPGVLYLIDDDAYVDIMFTEWGAGRGAGAQPGGPFAYTRAVVNLVPEPTAAALVGAVALGGFARRRR